jgi:hypothetical protein
MKMQVVLFDCGRASAMPFSVMPINPARYFISAISLFLAHMAKFLIAVLFIFPFLLILTNFSVITLTYAQTCPSLKHS